VVTHSLRAYFIAPRGSSAWRCFERRLQQRWIERKERRCADILRSSNTRLHVAASTVPKLLDYVMNTPADRCAVTPVWSSAAP